MGKRILKKTHIIVRIPDKENGPMNRHGNIRCEGCGSYNMNCYVGWTDCSDLCTDSDCNVLVSLDCEYCGRSYPIICLKSDYTVGRECFSFLKEDKENGKD